MINKLIVIGCRFVLETGAETLKNYQPESNRQATLMLDFPSSIKGNVTLKHIGVNETILNGDQTKHKIKIDADKKFIFSVAFPVDYDAHCYLVQSFTPLSN